jgi:hypothetical protein
LYWPSIDNKRDLFLLLPIVNCVPSVLSPTWALCPYTIREDRKEPKERTGHNYLIRLAVKKKEKGIVTNERANDIGCVL